MQDRTPVVQAFEQPDVGTSDIMSNSKGTSFRKMDRTDAGNASLELQTNAIEAAHKEHTENLADNSCEGSNLEYLNGRNNTLAVH